MKVLKRLLTSQLLSDKKGAVIDIDLIISYLIFMGLIIAVVQFTLGLVTVFSNDFRTLSREKNMLSASKLISAEFKASDINKLCNELNYTGIRVKHVEYEVLGFFMPKKDTAYELPNTGAEPKVLFLRDNNYLRVIVGSGAGSDTKVTVYVSMKYGTSVANKTLESGDSYTTYYDSKGYFVVKITSTVGNGDLDEIVIGPINNRTLIMPEVNNVTTSNVFVGDLSFNNSCGRTAIKGPQSSFLRYGTIMHDSELYPVKIKGDIWWTG